MTLPRRLARAQALVTLALILSSCARSPELASPAPGLARAPDVLTRACPQTAHLPATGLRAGEVAKFWGQDRSALAVCGARHQALVRHLRRQEGAQGGK